MAAWADLYIWLCWSVNTSKTPVVKLLIERCPGMCWERIGNSAARAMQMNMAVFLAVVADIHASTFG
jgi:hypothetical protein